MFKQGYKLEGIAIIEAVTTFIITDRPEIQLTFRTETTVTSLATVATDLTHPAYTVFACKQHTADSKPQLHSLILFPTATTI